MATTGNYVITIVVVAMVGMRNRTMAIRMVAKREKL